MKHVAVDFFHKLLLCLAICAVVLGGTLSLAKELLPWLPKHRVLIESFISNALQQEVSIDHIAIGWTRMEPFLQLLGVTIKDPKARTVTVLTLPEVDLQLNLIHSLWHKQFQFSRITFKNATLNLYQDAKQQWHLAGSESFSDFTDPAAANSTHAFIAWLLSIHHLQLEALTLHVHATDWPAFALNNTSIDFTNAGDRHQLFAQAALDGPSHAPVKLAISLKGPAQDFPALDASLYASVPGLDLSPWLTHKQWQHWQWQHGTLDSQVWAQWHQDHWQQLHVAVQSQQLRLNQTAIAHPWLIQSQHVTARGSWHADDQQWQWQLSSTAGQLGFGQLFRTPIPFDSIQTALHWSSTHNTLTIPTLLIKTPDVRASAALNLQLPPDASPIINLTLGAQLTNLNHSSLYLPTGIMEPSLVKWLDASNGCANVTGPCPTATGTAQMVLRGPLHHFPFADHSGLMDIRGQLHHLTLNYWPKWPQLQQLDVDCQFTQEGFRITSHHGHNAGIPIQSIEAVLPHYAAPAILHINALTAADLSQGVQFIQQSPLKTPLAALASSTSTGPFHLNLNLTIPLSHAGTLQWQGNVATQKDTIAWPDYPISVEDLQGNILFDNTTVSSQALSGRLWGSHMALNVTKTATDRRLQIDGHGVLDIKQLPSAWQFSFLRGKTPYQLHIALSDRDSHDASEFSVNSLLQGLSVNLPSGFNKTAASQTPLQVQGVLNAEGHLKTVKTTWALSKEPVTATLQINPESEQWQLNSPMLKGSVQIKAKQPWEVMVQHFQWQAAPGSADLKSSPFSFDPSHIPALNVRIEQFLIGEQGAFAIQAKLRPIASGGTAISELKLNNDLYQMVGNGVWTPKQTQVNGSIDTRQLQQVLQRLSLPTFIQADQSHVQFKLQWPGAPWQVTFATLAGTLSTKLSSGSLPDVGSEHATSIGFGKILNLLSINSLPQHLSFNFNDVAAKGFSFNTLEGAFELRGGLLKVPKLEVNSGVADVKAHGCIGVSQQNYQLVMQIKPHLTSSIPILATIAAGPIIGAVSLVADAIISPTINQITSSTYLLTGPWAAPVNQKYASDQAASAALRCP